MEELWLFWLLLALIVIAGMLGHMLTVKLNARDEAAERQRRWDAYKLLTETQPTIEAGIITAHKINVGDITAEHIRAEVIEIRSDDEQS